MATTSAAFVATMSGYLNVDAIIAFEHVNAEKLAAATAGVVIKLHSTASRVNSFKPLQKSNYLLADCLPVVKVRNVTRMEDLILRKATLRAGRLIAKGRFVSK
jgi:hypothetical protein